MLWVWWVFFFSRAPFLVVLDVALDVMIKKNVEAMKLTTRFNQLQVGLWRGLGGILTGYVGKIAACDRSWGVRMRWGSVVLVFGAKTANAERTNRRRGIGSNIIRAGQAEDAAGGGAVVGETVSRNRLTIGDER